MEINKELQKAIGLQKKGDFNEARKIYEKILKIKPDLAEIHFNLGIILKSLNKLDEAEESFAKILTLKPDLILAHYHMGNTKYKLRKFDESEYFYKKAISLNSNFVEAYINLSRAQRELGKLKESEENSRFAIKLNPDFFESHNQLSLILFDRGRLGDDLQSKSLDKLNEAKKYVLKAINLKPDHALSYLNYGLILQELGELDKSKESFQKSLDLEPNSELAKYNLNILLEQIKLLKQIGIDYNKKDFLKLRFEKQLNKTPFISFRKPNKDLIDLLYKKNSTVLNKTKGGPLFGNGKTSDYQLFNDKNLIIENVRKDLVDIIKKEIKSEVYIIDSFFNILGPGGGSVPHHHLNSFDKNFKLDKQKYSLTYYLSVGDQNCKEPGVFKLYEPDEEVLPTEGMVMIIPSGRKHSAVYGGKKDRVMIGINFYIF